MLRVPSNFAARAAYRPGQRLTTSAAHPPKAIRAFSVEETGRYRDRYRWPRRCTREKRIGSTMYALDVLPRSQQSERSRRWAAGSTSPTVRVPIASDSDIVFARQQGRALAAAMHFSATDSAFIATTISELARALFARTGRGEIWLHKVHENERSGVVIIARDPVAHDGRYDGRRAIASGLRLPDVVRLVDEFDVVWDAGRGTTIRATKWCRRRSRVTGG